MRISSSPQPAPVAPTPTARPTTQTQIAAAHLTPESRALLPDSLLDAKIGTGTLAGALNDQVRFRVERTGEPSDWKLLPDSPTAAALATSTAGAALLRQLRTAMGSTGSLARVSNLDGFILAKDTESVLAGLALSVLDDRHDSDGAALRQLGAAGDTAGAAAHVQAWRPGFDKQIASAGAWNADGWITFMPDTSRAMLVNAGAYRPNRTTERSLLDAKRWTTYLSGNASHEVQHSVSSPSPTAYQGAARWTEEGTANVFSRIETYRSKHAREAGLSPQRYAAMLAHEPAFETGWGDWKRPTLPKQEQDGKAKEQQRNYNASMVALIDLVHLAGAEFRSNAGKERAFQLLQARSMRFTPGVLADAIIERHHLDPTVRERLRHRIASAVDNPGGVAAIAKEFGIE